MAPFSSLDNARHSASRQEPRDLMQQHGTMAWDSGDYRFAPIVEADLTLLHRWLGEPHVREWWGEPDREIELIKENFTLNWIDSFLVSHEGRPFGYIQC